MYRIGIIGSENSHALAFTQIYNLSGQHADIRVVGIAGEDPEASAKVFQTGKLDFVAHKPQEFLGRVDGMMITSRHGGLHAGYARPFIEQGMPVFLDKPVTDRHETARELLKLAETCQAPVMGGSSVKLVQDVLSLQACAENAARSGELFGGHVWAPVSMANEYGGFCFYASHLVEVALTIFGFRPGNVRAVRTEKGVAALLDYDQYAVALSFMDEQYHYGGTVLTKQGPVTRSIDLSAGYELEAAHFADLLRTGKMPQTMPDMLIPVIVINAVEESFMTGQPVNLQLSEP